MRAEGFTIGQQDPHLKHGSQGQAHKKRAARTGGGNNIWGASIMHCGNLWERVILVGEKVFFEMWKLLFLGYHYKIKKIIFFQLSERSKYTKKKDVTMFCM